MIIYKRSDFSDPVFSRLKVYCDQLTRVVGSNQLKGILSMPIAGQRTSEWVEIISEKLKKFSWDATDVCKKHIDEEIKERKSKNPPETALEDKFKEVEVIYKKHLSEYSTYIANLTKSKNDIFEALSSPRSPYHIDVNKKGLTYEQRAAALKRKMFAQRRAFYSLVHGQKFHNKKMQYSFSDLIKKFIDDLNKGKSKDGKDFFNIYNFFIANLINETVVKFGGYIESEYPETETISGSDSGSANCFTVSSVQKIVFSSRNVNSSTKGFWFELHLTKRGAKSFFQFVRNTTNIENVDYVKLTQSNEKMRACLAKFMESINVSSDQKAFSQYIVSDSGLSWEVSASSLFGGGKKVRYTPTTTPPKPSSGNEIFKSEGVLKSKLLWQNESPADDGLINKYNMVGEILKKLSEESGWK